MTHEIDVCLISGHRPDLLRRTLDSFAERLLRHFTVRDVHANIDPFAGDAADGDACAALVAERFPQATLRRPEAPGFGAAVKWGWSQATDRPLLHMEDDWELRRDVRPGDVLPHLSARVTAVVFHEPKHGTSQIRGNLGERRERDKVLGVTWRRRPVGLFGTSPRVLSGWFARRAAALMDPELDPEKQMRPPHNPALRAFQDPYRSWFLFADDGTPALDDIGTPWREARGLRKTVVNGRSEWAYDP